MTAPSATVGMASLRGRRARNEDRGFIQPPWVFLLDGVGGSAAGAEAAQIGLAALLAGTARIDTADVNARELHRLMELAHEAVVEGTGGAGLATLTIAHLRPLPDNTVSVHFGWVGDSPAWIVSDGYEPVQLLPDTKAPGNLLQSALGWSPLQLHVCSATLSGEGRVVLASDGLLALSLEDRTELMTNPRLSAQECATALAEGAINAGGIDNTTALVLDVNRRRPVFSHSTFMNQ